MFDPSYFVRVLGMSELECIHPNPLRYVWLYMVSYKQYMGALGITLWGPHEGIQDSQRAWTPDQTNKMRGSLLMILDMDQNPQDILGK